MRSEKQSEQGGRRIVVRVKPPFNVQFIELSAEETLGATFDDILNVAKRRYCELLAHEAFVGDFEFQICTKGS